MDLSLRAGSALDSDDPFSIAQMAKALVEMTGAPLPPPPDTAARGVIAGISRLDMTLLPGDSLTVPLMLAAEEPAIIEARLKRGSDGADLDIRVTGPDGVLGQDIGPANGVVGQGIYLEFIPDRCLEVSVDITNAGSTEARAVMLAPASARIGCEG